MIAGHLQDRRALVTGATGFIGQHLVRHLLDVPGTRLRILARSRERVDEVFGPAASRFETVIGDIADTASVRGLCDGVETAYNCAAAVPYAFEGRDPGSEFDRVNVRGTACLALEALRAGAKRLVHLSSTAAMGTPVEAVVDETTPCRPTSSYQVSKRAAEEGLLELRRESSLDVVIVRSCLVAGEGKRGGEFLKLFKLCRRGVFPVIGGRLDVEKPLIAVEDVVQALLRASIRGRAGEIYLVHSGGKHTLGQVLRVAGRLVGNSRPYVSLPLALARAGAHISTPMARLLRRSPPLTPQRLQLLISDRHIDIRKARQELGYSPEHQNVEEMLGRTHAYYVRTGQL